MERILIICILIIVLLIAVIVILKLYSNSISKRYPEISENYPSYNTSFIAELNHKMNCVRSIKNDLLVKRILSNKQLDNRVACAYLVSELPHYLFVKKYRKEIYSTPGEDDGN